jgi:uncharacterized membrane protein
MQPDERSEVRLYERESHGLEFERIALFSDAVFAIAMTLLVVELHLPKLEGDPYSAGAMLRALSEVQWEIVSIFIGFLLIGRYWITHHGFIAGLRAVDPFLLRVNVAYLAVVAFLPFPIEVVGAHEENVVSALLFAVCLILVSLFELVMYQHAVRKNLTRRELTPEEYRSGLLGVIFPIGYFAVTAPIAFWNPQAALYAFALLIPISIWLRRRAPNRDKPLFG